MRTDPASRRHHGLTWLICDMRSPGIEIRPITTMLLDEHVNTVFYDEVRIPRANVVGEIGDGWSTALATLSFERGTGFIGDQLELYERVQRAIELAKQVRLEDGRLAIDHDDIAERLASLKADTMAIRAMTLREHRGDGPDRRAGAQVVADEADGDLDAQGARASSSARCSAGSSSSSTATGPSHPWTYDYPVELGLHDRRAERARSSARSRRTGCSACRGRGDVNGDVFPVRAVEPGPRSGGGVQPLVRHGSSDPRRAAPRASWPRQRFRRVEGPWPSGKHDYLTIWEMDDPAFALAQLAQARGTDTMPISPSVDMSTVQPPTMWRRATVRSRRAHRDGHERAQDHRADARQCGRRRGRSVRRRARCAAASPSWRICRGVISAELLTLADAADPGQREEVRLRRAARAARRRRGARVARGSRARAAAPRSRAVARRGLSSDRASTDDGGGSAGERRHG